MLNFLRILLCQFLLCLVLHNLPFHPSEMQTLVVVSLAKLQSMMLSLELCLTFFFGDLLKVHSTLLFELMRIIRILRVLGDQTGVLIPHALCALVVLVILYSHLFKMC